MSYVDGIQNWANIGMTSGPALHKAMCAVAQQIFVSSRRFWHAFIDGSEKR
jgi:hypothetical protein